MTSDRDYSVIIPSHRRPELLRRALNSVYAQTLPPAEILLVIDEPEDWEKYRFLRDYDERLKVSFTGGGKGGAGARNIGLDRASTGFVFFLDDDDEWLPEKCELQIEAFKSDQSAVGVSCWREVCQETGARIPVRISEREVNEWIRARNVVGSFSFFGFRRNAATGHLRLDENLEAAQDFEFYIRLADFGSTLVVRRVLVRYFNHGGSQITDSRYRKLRALEYIYRKHSVEWSFWERMWWLGKLEVFRAGQASNWADQFFHLCKAIPPLALALRSPVETLKLLKKGIRFAT